MGKLILKMSMSVDGFVADADGGASWIFNRPDDKAVAWTVETISKAGIHIMGSRTFRDMASWWPTSTQPFAPAMNLIPKAVFSKSGTAILTAGDTTKTLEDATRHSAATDRSAELQPGADSWARSPVMCGDLATDIATLKEQMDKPVLAHGGAGFARSLAAAGLIDEFHLLVHPIALGKGLALFADLAAPIPFNLLSSTRFPGGAVAQVYGRS
jgi:dihydrofolate reductase